VVIYCSVDQTHSEPILKEFEKATGIRVKAVYDSEAVKTVGLVNRLRAEAKHPQADVFWNNEMMRTYQLAAEGVCETPAPFAARVRVLVYNTDLVKAEDAPQSILDLADPKWRGKAAMAYPMFGTTATHAAALFAVWGEERAKAYFESLKANDVRIYEGNSTACEQVALGHCAIGITDTDDFWERKARGMPLAMVYPDQSDSPSTPALGACVIPNTVALIKGARRPETAKRLADWLLTTKVEEKLAFGPSRQLPMLGGDVPVPEGVRRLSELRVMEFDVTRVAEAGPASSEFLRRTFLR
jgi:iron(III) transport system substrate-binding protein